MNVQWVFVFAVFLSGSYLSMSGVVFLSGGLDLGVAEVHENATELLERVGPNAWDVTSGRTINGSRNHFS
jgi:hypothetical protein